MTKRNNQNDPRKGVQAGVRLDKWLCAARFFKTRALAGEAITGGHVHLNGARVKASRAVYVDDSLEITRKEFTWSVKVKALGEKRGSADRARELYEETAESIATREQTAGEKRAMSVPMQDSGSGRPSKRDRRRLEQALRKRLL